MLARICRSIAPLLVLALLAPPDRAPAAPVATPDTTDWIPLDLALHPLPLVPVEVEGIPTLAFVDSGAGLTVVSDSLARAAGLVEGTAARARGAAGESAATIHEGVSLAVGGTILADRRVVAIDLSEVAAMVGRPVGAILGADVFRTHVVDLDYPRRRMALRDSSWVYAGPGHVIPLELRGAQWAIPARIEGLPPTAVDLDTGSDETLTIYAAYAERHDLLDDRDVATHVQAGVGGVREIRVGVLRRLEIGGIPLHDVPVAFDPGDGGAMAGRTEGGNLGSGALARFRTVFDVPRGRLVLVPEPDPALFPKDRSGLQTRWAGDHLAVIHVAPGSPADEAGWEPGDRIVSVDGVPVRPETRHEIRGWGSRPAGTPIVLVDGRGRQRQIVLRDYFGPRADR